MTRHRLAVIWPLTLAVVADAVVWLVLLLGCVTIGAGGGPAPAANPTGWALHTTVAR